MFGLLKNKLAGFIKGIVGREEKIQQAAPAVSPAELKKEPAAQAPVPPPPQQETPLQEEPKKAVEEKKQEPKEEKKPEPVEAPQKTEEKKPEHAVHHPKTEEKKRDVEQHHAHAEPVHAPKPEETKPAHHAPKPSEQPPETAKPEQHHAPKPSEQPRASRPSMQEPPRPSTQTHQAVSVPAATPHHAQKSQEEKPASTPPAQQPFDISRLEKKASSEKRDFAPKVGLVGTIKSFFSSDITIGEPEVADLLEGLELSLLEADVAYDVSLEVSQQLRQKLVGMKVPKGEVEKRAKEAVQSVLESIMDSDRKFDLLSRVKAAEKPVKILFVGPNGAGKTTTMAKLAHLFMKSGLTVVFSASDTFRAAAVEQTEAHASRLGAKVVKSKYGADPSSVAFDAVNYARSHSIDVVLIDSAGRQDTNANLLSELKKINRVAKPDIKIYIGESIGGNSVIEQIKAFNEAIGMDGAILTKIDCDAKGGTAISIAKAAGLPVLFLGMGQGYDDLVPFDPHKIAQEIMT